MFRYLRMLWYRVTGQIDKLSEELAQDKHVTAKIYDNAITAEKEGVNDLIDAISELADIRDQVQVDLEKSKSKLTYWKKVLDGAAGAAKRRAQEIVANQKEKGGDEETIKQSISLDTDYQKANSAFNEASHRISELSPVIERMEQELANKDKSLLLYKSKLQEKQRNSRSLEEEKATTLAEAAINMRAIALQQRLAGISEGRDDKDLEMVRKAHRKISTKSQVLTDLVGEDVNAIDKEYAAYAERLTASSDLEKMLDLDTMIKGDKTPVLQPAKLPE